MTNGDSNSQVRFNLFKDDQHTKHYAKYRPRYPAELYQAIVNFYHSHNHSAFASLPTKGRIKRCVDIACGSGQATVQLAESYCETVTGVDPSQTQLDNATHSSDNDATVRYVCASAEHTGLPSQSFDLVTVAQALHWFDFDAFWLEVDRLLVPGGVLAAWTYALNRFEDNAAAEEVLHTLYDKELSGKYWNERRRLVDDHYASIVFPWEHTVQRRVFEYRTSMPLSAYVNYIITWSAIQTYREVNGEDMLHELMDRFRSDLMQAFGCASDSEEVVVVWPMYLTMARKPDQL